MIIICVYNFQHISSIFFHFYLKHILKLQKFEANRWAQHSLTCCILEYYFNYWSLSSAIKQI